MLAQSRFRKLRSFVSPTSASTNPSEFLRFLLPRPAAELARKPAQCVSWMSRDILWQ